MNEDETTIAVIHRLSEAISNACNRRYEAAGDCLFEAKEWLEVLRDEYELGIEEEDEN